MQLAPAAQSAAVAQGSMYDRPLQVRMPKQGP
jgi:hypothetical protein